MTLPMMAVGARGVISVAANFVPRGVAELVKAALAGNLDLARQLHHKMFRLSRALFCETNPIPCKGAMEMLGLCAGDVRLPLTPMREASRTAVKQALSDYGLIET
jgi:4-hydroxy-tetrahydrodipicolinate synthase